MDLLKSAQTASGKRAAARQRAIAQVTNEVADLVEKAFNGAATRGAACPPEIAQALDEGLGRIGGVLVAEHERANGLDRQLAEAQAVSKSLDARVTEAVEKIRLPEGTRVVNADGSAMFEVGADGMLKPEAVAKLAEPSFSLGDVLTHFSKAARDKDKGDAAFMAASVNAAYDRLAKK